MNLIHIWTKLYTQDQIYANAHRCCCPQLFGQDILEKPPSTSFWLNSGGKHFLFLGRKGRVEVNWLAYCSYYVMLWIPSQKSMVEKHSNDPNQHDIKAFDVCKALTISWPVLHLLWRRFCLCQLKMIWCLCMCNQRKESRLWCWCGG